MLKTRYLIRLIYTYLTRFKLLLFISTVFGIIFFISFRYIIIPIIGRNVQIIGLTGRFTTSELPTEIQSLLSDGLTKIDNSGIPQSSLASSWEYSSDEKTWTFHLKKDIYWHDGTQLSSENITYEFNDLEILRPNSETLVFKLKNPFSPLPSILSKPLFKVGLVGTGKWKVKNVTLAGNYMTRLDLIDKEGSSIIFKFYPTDDRTKLAYKLGQVKEIINVSDPTPFDNWNTVNLKKNLNTQQVVTLFFNTQDNVLTDKSIRQALNYAIDKEVLGKRALGPISPNSAFFNPQVKRYDFSSDHAKEILDELSKKQKEELKVNIVTAPFLLNVAERISKDWEAIGVKSDVQVSSIIPSDFQAYLTVLDIPKDPDQYSLWHSTQVVNNISRYSSPRIDKLLEDGRVLTETEKRKEVYFDFQRFINEDTPAIFLYHPEYYSISKK